MALGQGTLISYVRIFTDASDYLPHQVIPFTDLGKAEDFARQLREDMHDALQGINKVELSYAVPTDDWAVEQFWMELAEESGS